jgi:zinc protease
LTTTKLETGTKLTDSVYREVLENGLTVLIKENHTAPVAAIVVSVRAGYFNEPDCWNGIAHVIEHMLFKGTERRPGNDAIAEAVRALGGMLNAATYYEETYYYTVVPSGALIEALDIQSDAVLNSRIDPEELAKELEVIVQESLQKRDNPTAMLIESLYALAYDEHRIRRWRIGMPDTLRGFRRDDLAAFMSQAYSPGNITLTVVGDLDTSETLEAIKQIWGSRPAAPPLADFSPGEPEHVRFRYRRILGPTKQRLVMMAFPGPGRLHEDSAALTVLSAVLSDGRSARLYRRLKEDLKIVSTAWASFESFQEMGIISLGGECLFDDPRTVERELWQAARQIQHEPIATEELERVKRRVEARMLFAQEEVLGVARTLAVYQNYGDYHLADKAADEIAAVTPADIMRVAQKYLDLNRASLMEYLPEESQGPLESDPEHVRAEIEGMPPEVASPVPASHPPSFHVGSPSPSTGDAEAITLLQGGTLYFRARHDLPIVAITVLFPGGRRSETMANCGITNLMLKSTLKGTRRYSASEIAARIEGLGSSIGTTSTADYLGFGTKLTRNALTDGIDVLREVIAAPVFEPDEVERERQSILADIRRQQDSISSLAMDLLSAACFGELPYGLPSIADASALSAITSSDLVAWHAGLVRPDTMAIGLVGDLTRDEAIELASSLLTSPATAEPGMDRPSVFQLPAIREIERPKKQTATAIALRGVHVSSPDRHALDLLATVTSGMAGRFFHTVRGENALAYQVAGLHRSRRDAGIFIAYTSTAPHNADLARDLLLNECRRLVTEPPTPDEIASAKATLEGQHVIGNQTFGAQAGELASSAVFGMPPDEPERSLEAIRALQVDDLVAATETYLNPDAAWIGVVRGTDQSETDA